MEIWAPIGFSSHCSLAAHIWVVSDSESHSTTVRQEEKLQTEGRLLSASVSSSNLEIAILLATAHGCAELYSLQLARELHMQYLIGSNWPYREVNIIIPTLQLKRLRLKDIIYA